MLGTIIKWTILGLVGWFGFLLLMFAIFFGTMQ